MLIRLRARWIKKSVRKFDAYVACAAVLGEGPAVNGKLTIYHYLRKCTVLLQMSRIC